MVDKLIKIYEDLAKGVLSNRDSLQFLSNQKNLVPEIKQTIFWSVYLVLNTGLNTTDLRRLATFGL